MLCEGSGARPALRDGVGRRPRFRGPGDLPTPQTPPLASSVDLSSSCTGGRAEERAGTGPILAWAKSLPRVACLGRLSGAGKNPNP
jgi:hypothetical protein